MSYQYPLLVTNIHIKKKTKHEKFDGGLSNTIEKLVSGAGAPSRGTFPARGLEPIKIVARSNHNKLQYGGRRSCRLDLESSATFSVDWVTVVVTDTLVNMSKSRRGKSASANELSRWETELIQTPFNEVNFTVLQFPVQLSNFFTVFGFAD